MTFPISTLFLRDITRGGPPDQLATVTAALAEDSFAADGSWRSPPVP